MLVHSFIHCVALWGIKDHSKFGKWCAWVHQPSDLGIFRVFSQVFFGSAPMRGVAMKIVRWKELSVCNGEYWNFTPYLVFSPQYSLMIFFMMWSIFPILMPYLLWIILILRILFLRIIGRYSQRGCQTLVLVFQSRFCSILPWVCHMFQHKWSICKSYIPMIIHHDQRSF